MHGIRAQVVGIVVTVFTVGCASDATEAVPDANLSITTDKASYSLATDAAARPVLHNLGPARVYAPINEYVTVERLDDGKWRNRQAWFSVDGIGVSTVIAPGDSLAGVPMSFGYVDRQPGVYRFVFEVAYDSLGRNMVPEQRRVSWPFELRP